MAKRAKNEGSIYRDKRDNWWAQLPAGPDGRRPRRKAATEAEALLKLRELHAERAAGRDPSRRAETVAELLDDWLETMQPHVRATTLRHYRDGCDHITGRIGKMHARDVNSEVVQRVATDLYGAGLGPDTVYAALSRLWSAYDRLIPERFSVNPVNWRKLRLRKRVRAVRNPLDAAQLRSLIMAADDMEARGAAWRYAAAVWLGGLLGMRRGEIFGLTWHDVDFAKAEIHIRQQRAEGTAELFSPPKTDDSSRTLPVGPKLLARLHQLWEVQQAERRHRGKDWKDHDLVLCREDGTPPSLDTLRDLLIALAAALQLPHVHPHLLRHSMASLLDELGYSQSVIGDLLGHTGKALAIEHNHGQRTSTGRYIRARNERLRKAVEAIEAAIFAAIDAATEEEQ